MINLSLVLLIVGIIAVLFSVVSVIISVFGTPDNLRGFYSAKYILITLGGFIAGGVMIAMYFLL